MSIDGGDEDNTTKQSKRRRRSTIDKVHYDFLTRPLESDGTDGDWKISNPIDPTTGLLYDSAAGDWADLAPTLLRHGYDKGLGLQETSEVPLLWIERSYNPPPLRQQMLEILMEECQVPATFMSRDATLAAYANAKTTATVMDIGYSGTTVSPVVDGYVEPLGIRRSPIGSLAMDELALQKLQQVVKSNGKTTALKPIYQVRGNPKNKTLPRQPAFHRLALLAVAQDAREGGSLQSINTAASKALQVPSMTYTLPDGTDVDVPSQHRFAVADHVLGSSSSGSSGGGNSSNLSLIHI